MYLFCSKRNTQLFWKSFITNADENSTIELDSITAYEAEMETVWIKMLIILGIVPSNRNLWLSIAMVEIAQAKETETA